MVLGVFEGWMGAAFGLWNTLWCAWEADRLRAAGCADNLSVTISVADYGGG